MKCEASVCRDQATRELYNREFSRFIKVRPDVAERMRRGDPARVCDYHYQRATLPPLPHIQSESLRSARRVPQLDRGVAA